MPDVVIFGDTVRSPELRHELPLVAPDPLIYVEQNGSRHVFAGSLEVPRLAELDGLKSLRVRGARQRRADRGRARSQRPRAGARPAGLPQARRDQRDRSAHVPARRCGPPARRGRRARHGRRALRPAPAGQDGAELAGIRRAVRATEAAYARAKELLAQGEQTCEGLKAAINVVFAEQGVMAPDPPLVSHGAQTTVGHDPGSGPIAPGEPVVLDLFPQDPESGCFSDMTRTFCVGEAPEELVRYHAALRGVDPARAAAHPAGRDRRRAAPDLLRPFEEAGIKTQLSKSPDEVLEEGLLPFARPRRRAGAARVADPRTKRRGARGGRRDRDRARRYRLGFGGCRIEDLVLVTEDGHEVLSNFPHDLVV